MKNTPFAHYQRTQYNPHHYRFARRIEGYYPDKPNRGDRAVGITCGLILLGYLVYLALEYLK